MITQIVYDNISRELAIPKELLPEGGVKYDHHFLGTDSDNLVELAGRTCYDSCKFKNTRSSQDYHKHINDVNHGSTQEHLNFTVKIQYDAVDLPDYLVCLGCRPGLFYQVYPAVREISISANARSVIEYDKYPICKISNNTEHFNNQIRYRLQGTLKDIAPMLIDFKEPWNKDFVIGSPTLDHEIWFSFYISGISRSCSHELVRHKYQTAISQRSTRYVDESSSNWALHPLFERHASEETKGLAARFIESSKALYEKCNDELQKTLVATGVDKFNARKQSRAASSRFLGNGLETEMIWSCSIGELKRIMGQRCSNGADAEIRLLGNRLIDLVNKKYPHIIWHTGTHCLDGFGMEYTLVK